MSLRAGALTGLMNQSTAQVIDGSLKFDRSTNCYLTRTPSIVGNRKTFTYSCWFRKLSENLEQNLFSVKDGVDNDPGTRRDAIRFESTNKLKMFIDNSADGSFDTYDHFRDNGWYHIVVAVDTTLSTESDRVKIYKNGEQFGLSPLRPFESYGYPNQNTDCDINTLNLHTIGSDAESAPNHVFDGNMSQVYFIDGQQLDATYFGFTDPLTNTWRPKKFDIGKTPSGSWGTNGFYLPMDGNSPIGEDKSGNGNNWTPVNFSGTFNDPDVLKDSPSGAVFGGPPTSGITTTSSAPSNYATLNPLTGNNTLSNGNLDSTGNQTAWRGNAATIGVSGGKWYFESIVLSTNSGNVNADWGIVLDTNSQWGGQTVGDYGISYYGSNGNKEKNNNNASTSSSGATTGDVVQVAFDLDKGKIWFGVNNTWIDSGNPSAGSNEAYTVESGTWLPAVAMYDNGTVSTNFGQKPFKYTPPDGFQPLNVANIRPETVITRPDHYVGVTTYVGNAPPGSTNTQSFNIGFKPDLLWFKVRSADSNHFLIDSVRTREKVLFSNQNNNQSTCDVGKDLVSFDHNGFTVGEGNQTGANENNQDIVAWSWKAGGNSNTFNVDDVGYATAAAAGISGLDDTNQMTTANYLGCSIGTKQGFSIINYRGVGGSNDVTIPHGLSQSPDLVMIKNQNSSVDWAVAHSGLVDNRELHLNTNEDSVSVAYLGLYKSNFTSTSFAVNYGESNSQYVNANNELYIAYVWHNVPGLQKFGSYKSNNSADGPYIELGFRPAIILIKCTSGTESWAIYDSERVPYNYNGLPLTADTINDEPTSNTAGYGIDFLSNGFKIRGQWGSINDTNTTDHYIYAAWAESPSVNLYGGQSNAR